MDSLDKLKNWKERVNWWEKVSIPLDRLSNAPTSTAPGQPFIWSIALALRNLTKK